MAKRDVLKDATSRIEYVWIADSSSSVGAGLTGLAFNTSGLAAHYVRPGGSATSITLATQTVTGAFSSGGFVEVSSANMPGLYRFDPPNAAFATGVDKVVIELKGAANMVPVLLEYQLVSVDPESDRQARAIDGIVIGTADTGASTTSIPTSSLSPASVAADQFKGAVLVFSRLTTTTALRGQRTTITANTSGGTLTVVALTTAPASGDIFAIL